MTNNGGQRGEKRERKESGQSKTKQRQGKQERQRSTKDQPSRITSNTATQPRRTQELPSGRASQCTADIMYTPQWSEEPPLQSFEARAQDHKTFESFLQDMEHRDYLRRLSSKETKNQSFLPTFQVPKRGWGLRTIVDCKETINPHLASQPSTQPGQRQVIAWSQTQPFIGKRDLKDSYHCVPIHPDHQRHFGLYYKGKAYRWQGMIMGLQVAPSVFQQINDTILKGLNHRTYLDDSFYGGATFEEALQQRELGDRYTGACLLMS